MDKFSKFCRKVEDLSIKDIHLLRVYKLNEFGEYSPVPNIYYNYLKLGDYYYHIYITKVKTNKWKLKLSICFMNIASDDVLIKEINGCTIKGLKWIAVETLKDYIRCEKYNIDTT